MHKRFSNFPRNLSTIMNGFGTVNEWKPQRENAQSPGYPSTRPGNWLSRPVYVNNIVNLLPNHLRGILMARSIHIQFGTFTISIRSYVNEDLELTKRINGRHESGSAGVRAT